MAEVNRVIRPASSSETASVSENETAPLIRRPSTSSGPPASADATQASPVLSPALSPETLGTETLNLKPSALEANATTLDTLVESAPVDESALRAQLAGPRDVPSLEEAVEAIEGGDGVEGIEAFDEMAKSLNQPWLLKLQLKNRMIRTRTAGVDRRHTTVLPTSHFPTL